MKTLDNPGITTLLNLKSSELISDSIAQRQLEVIRKGFNFLMQPDNNVLYIGDEVGLGKTYIALGIASLLRHFSDDPGSYQDVIIVPKENLQHKWEKEIRQFIANNYLVFDNRVKSIIGRPVGEIQLIDKLASIDNDHPAYHIFRNSQFSLGFSRNRPGGVKDEMLSQLKHSVAKEIIEEAWELGYFNLARRSALKKLYAYLFSFSNPEIELLVVDEGHNYKHGLGSDEDDEVSDRNNVICRFFGLRRNHPDDKELFSDFPRLRDYIRPKVKKLIVLSATPKTYSLLELRNQLDCFLDRHLLKGAKREDEIKEKLERFVIRGNMEYQVNGESYTRNLCRHEHRRGNVEKLSDAPELLIDNDEQAIILGLLQYSTIKHLDAKNNASFEIGMLAGFETFSVDQNRIFNSKQDGEVKEYEETRNRKVRTSQDHDVVKTITESYRERFGDAPPHPKQDAIVNATSKMMLKGEKSLIFVRRVNSAFEMEERLLRKWEDEVYNNLAGIWMKKLPSEILENLVDAYREYRQNRKLLENLDNIISGICTKLNDRKNFDLSFLQTGINQETLLATGLKYLHSNYKKLPQGEEFYNLLCRQCALKFIKPELVQLAYTLLQETCDKWLTFDTEEDDSEEEAYFFHAYFRRPDHRSFRKSRIHKNDWFDPNYYLLNETFKITSFKPAELTAIPGRYNDLNDIKEVQDVFLKNITNEPYQGGILDPADYPGALVSKKTLVTELLTVTCRPEFEQFLQNLSGKSPQNIFGEIKMLVEIIASILRNGSGLLPLYIADKADGDFISNFTELIETEGIFNLVLKELRLIIKDYSLLRSVNFPDSEGIPKMRSKLLYQSPVAGLTGMHGRSKTNVATQFRMPGFPYILVTTDILREGEDLHTYCDNVYHYGIAWNCSDMEQRTGRIDRINSLSHRKLSQSGELLFDNRVHVFYPYIKNTLEVNQVNRLFTSINSFVKTFNDFTENVVEEGVVAINEAIGEMVPALNQHFKSKYEHHNFRGYEENGHTMEKYDCIGMQKPELISFLENLQSALKSAYDYKFPPTLDLPGYTLYGDIHLLPRDRRGPFKIIVKNDIHPGKFLLEANAHLFKVNLRMIRKVNDYLAQHDIPFQQGNVDEYSCLTFTQSIETFDSSHFLQQLYRMVEIADDIEKVAVDLDVEVFG